MNQMGKWFRGFGILAVVSIVGCAVIVFLSLRLWRGTELTHASNLVASFVLAPLRMPGTSMTFARDFDVTSTGAILVHSSDSIYAIDPAQPSTPLILYNETATQVDSIAVDADDSILTIANRFFGIVNRVGGVEAAFPLPSVNLRLARSVREDCVYLFGGEADSHRLYLFHADGTFEILIDNEEPIESVTDTAEKVYFAAKDRIFEMTPKGLTLLLDMPGSRLDGGIISIAVSLDGNSLFFATKSKIFAMRGEGAISIVNDSGGSLQIRENRLYVLDRDRELLYYLTGAEKIFN